MKLQGRTRAPGDGRVHLPLDWVLMVHMDHHEGAVDLDEYLDLVHLVLDLGTLDLPLMVHVDHHDEDDHHEGDGRVHLVPVRG